MERKKNIFRGVRKYMFTDKKTQTQNGLCFLYLSQFDELYMSLCSLRLISGTPQSFAG